MRYSRIIQPNDYTCVAAVSAMIVGKTMEHFFQHVGHDGSEVDKEKYPHHPDGRRAFTDWEMLSFLIANYHTLGFEVFFNKSYLYSDPKELYITQGTFHEKGWPKHKEWPYIEAKIVAGPALVTVKSERLQGCRHAVLWTGVHVHDPNPAAAECRSLEEYIIYSWWPVIDLSDDRRE